MFALMGTQLRTHPELALGGPSMNWVREALDEADALHAMRSPDLPCICVVGENERIVDVARAADRMRRWPGGEFYAAPGGEHEVLMEAPEIRREVVNRIVGTFLNTRVAASA
jgi:lysophospholipase